MKIIRVDAVPVSIPRVKPFTISSGSTASSNRLITRIHAEEGVVGIGEAAPAPIFSPETLGTTKLVVEKYLAQAVIGEDAFNIEKSLQKMDDAIVGNPIAKASVEIALWDLMGKAVEMPVYKLLGGAYRSKVEVAWIIGIAKPIEMCEEAKDAVHKGFTTLKMKIGTNPKLDVERVKAVREAVGDEVAIRVDANEAYSTIDAIDVLTKMESYNLELIEQPVPRWDLRGLSKIRKSLHTPIMVDESVLSPMDVMKVIERDAADIINIKLMKVGGLSNAKKIATVAEAAGLPCLLGSMIELSIGTAAGVHFACSTSKHPLRNRTGGDFICKGRHRERSFPS